ncbi:MAG: thioredoxin domain-containing protein, partial [Bacteroidales bacterium]
MGKAGKIILVMVSLVFCQSMIWGQSVKNIRTADLERMLKTQDDKLYIINFWATWCAPCVRELPYFEKLSKVYD